MLFYSIKKVFRTAWQKEAAGGIGAARKLTDL